MKTFFAVTTIKLLSHFFLCFHEVRTVNFIHQHPVDFLLHRLSCVLTVMESDNISCLPNPFCKCIVFRFRIQNLSHKLLLSVIYRRAGWQSDLPNCLPVFCSFARQREDSYSPIRGGISIWNPVSPSMSTRHLKLLINKYLYQSHPYSKKYFLF